MLRLVKTDDVAAATPFLASDECGYATGVNPMVNRGWMAARGSKPCELQRFAP